MTSVTPFRATDLLSLNAVNLDVLTENYQLEYYLEYLIRWPSLMFKVDGPQRCVGYMMAKSEGRGREWHSHISAVTVDMEFRRLGLAGQMVEQLRLLSETPDENCYFMDLFVRTSNNVAVGMYKRLGFMPFRRVLQYYGSGKNEDAFDMRMPLARDPRRETLIKGAHTEESPHYKYRYDKKALQ